MKISFGPSGLGGVKEAIKNLEKFHELGLKACEISFTYGPYIKTKEDAKKIGEKAKELGIYLSIHAHYWINLNSEDEKKVEMSKKRILSCLKIGTWLGAKRVIFHPGYYGKMGKIETYEKIKKEILELQELRKENDYAPELAPETTGKVNVFGSVEEISQLVTDTKCSFAIDFAHILARDKDYRFGDVKKLFGKADEWHIHFSGIDYGEKGERKHLPTKEKEIKELLSNLPTEKTYFVINESPDPVTDSVKSLSIYQKEVN